MKKKIMFVYLKTGGGHVAPAKALSSYLLENKADSIETVLVDGIGGLKFFKWILEDGYRILQNNAEWFYEVIYFFYKIKFIAKISDNTFAKKTRPYLRVRLLQEQPDLIVVLHFFMIQPIYSLIESGEIKAKAITIVTDPFTAHPLWFVRKDIKFIVFSDKLKRVCMTLGIDDNNIAVFPFVISSKFSIPLNSEEIQIQKERFGLNDRKTILLLGGADGIRKGTQIVRAILRKSYNCEIIIVCGKNNKLFQSMTTFKSENKLTQLKVLGFTEFVFELINISDIIITKCGASTITEILLSNKIPIINRYLWEQEKGNVEYVLQNELGIYEKDVTHLAIRVDEFLKNEGIYLKYLDNIKSHKLKNGLADVGDFLSKYVEDSSIE